ncbi:hypothetical protein A3Q56_02009 [Intoshia linei]|uniref:Nuclear respiratory factor 1 NLS/DNA-binding dimerisation domain-containing protein n=1 Tax=Intoshia linei TaxID=1819745 RepID=A0A177B9X6_9BILA|nr:hypothetical protein A3Q56_02009 [Intoshia linei]
MEDVKNLSRNYTLLNKIDTSESTCVSIDAIYSRLRRNQKDIRISRLLNIGMKGISAAAINVTTPSNKKYFIMDPVVRKQRQRHGLNVLKELIKDVSNLTGTQIVCIIHTESEMSNLHATKIIGSEPLLSTVFKYKSMIQCDMERNMEQLANMLIDETPKPEILPIKKLTPLYLNGFAVHIRTVPVVTMRSFIPEIIKISCNRSSVNWGNILYKPKWWPVNIPFLNVKSDSRSDKEKRKKPWAEALRDIIISCYEHHGVGNLLFDIDGYDSPQKKKNRSVVKSPSISSKKPEECTSEIDFGECKHIIANDGSGNLTIVKVIKVKMSDPSKMDYDVVQLKDGSYGKILEEIVVDEII